MSKLTQFFREVKLIENRLRHTDSGDKDRLKDIRTRIEALSAAGVKSELQQELIKTCQQSGHQWALAHDYRVCTICQKIEVTK